MNYLFVLLALVGGAVLPLQAGINAELARRLASPFWATGVSFLIGTIGLGTFLFFLRTSWPALSVMATFPWWIWVGGLLGAIYVSIVILTTPQLGVASLISLAVAGQMLASLVFDHYGLIGLQRHTLSEGRILGAILLVVGVIMINKY